MRTYRKCHQYTPDELAKLDACCRGTYTLPLNYRYVLAAFILIMMSLTVAYGKYITDHPAAQSPLPIALFILLAVCTVGGLMTIEYIPKHKVIRGYITAFPDTLGGDKFRFNSEDGQRAYLINSLDPKNRLRMDYETASER